MELWERIFSKTARSQLLTDRREKDILAKYLILIRIEVSLYMKFIIKEVEHGTVHTLTPFPPPHCPLGAPHVVIKTTRHSYQNKFLYWKMISIPAEIPHPFVFKFKSQLVLQHVITYRLVLHQGLKSRLFYIKFSNLVWSGPTSSSQVSARPTLFWSLATSYINFSSLGCSTLSFPVMARSIYIKLSSVQIRIVLHQVL